MKKHNPTPALILVKDYNNPDHASVDTKHPLKLRINYRRDRKYFGTAFKFTSSEWNQINQIRPLKRFQEDKRKTDKILNRAKEILASMDADGNEFRFNRFETIWFQIKPKGTEFNNLFKVKYDELIADQPKTASQYWLAISSLHKFNDKSAVRYADLTVDFLKSYEKWMLAGADDGKPRAKTTIGMYLRCARHIYLHAIEKGYVKKETYPFGKGKYQIPTGKNIKKALEPDEVSSLMSYVPQSEQEARARDMFLLSLFCNGANFKDLCTLKWSNLDGDKITFQRNKTLKTLKQPKVGTIIVTPEINSIIDRWGNTDRSQNNYILPILNNRFKHFSRKEGKEIPTTKEYLASRINELISEFIKQTNKQLRRILDNLGIEKHVTTYAARHTYATILRNKGVSTEFIQEQLLHSSILTTQNYLADFPDQTKREHAQTLLDAIKDASK